MEHLGQLPAVCWLRVVDVNLPRLAAIMSNCLYSWPLSSQPEEPRHHHDGNQHHQHGERHANLDEVSKAVLPLSLIHI